MNDNSSAMPHKILIVDDEESIRFYLASALADRYAVLTAADGAAALELIKTEQPELVLLDVKMPGLGGVETLERVKEAGLSPIIWMLTGVEDLDVVLRTLQLGATGYVTKPVDLDRVKSIVMDALGEVETSDKSWTIKK